LQSANNAATGLLSARPYLPFAMVALALAPALATGYMHSAPALVGVLRPQFAHSTAPGMFVDEFRESLAITREWALGEEGALEWRLRPWAPSAEPAPVPEAEEEDGMLWAWQLGLLAITACWGANFATTKFALDALGDVEGGGALFVAGRFVVGAAALLPFVFSSSSAAAVRAGAQVGALCAFGYAAQSIALSMGSCAGSCAFICSLQSVVVAVAASAFSGNHVQARTWAAIALSVTGVGCLELPSLLDATAGAGPAVGISDLIAFGQPLGFGLSYVVLEQAMAEHPDDELPLAALQCAVIAAAAVGAASLSSDAAPWTLPWEALLPRTDGTGWGVTLALGYTSLISTALTIWLQAKVFKRVPSTDASLILASEPLWATGFAVALLGDSVQPTAALGGALILAALGCNAGLLDFLAPAARATKDE